MRGHHRRIGARFSPSRVAVIAATTLALAASPALGYAGFKFQRYYPQSADIAGAKPDNGIAVDLGFGRNLGVELSVGALTTDIPASSIGTPLDVGLLVMPVTLSGFAQHRFGYAGVYAVAGTGVYVTDSFEGFDVKGDVSPGFQLGAGFWVWMIAIEARYVFTTVEIAGHERSIDGWVVGIFGGVR